MTNPATLARNTNPESSHAAAEEVAFSGAHETQCNLIARAVERYPGQTSRELATVPMLRKAGLDRYDVARRLSDLEQVDRVRSIRRGRKCKVSGRLAMTWWPVLVPRRLFNPPASGAAGTDQPTTGKEGRSGER